MSDTKRDDSSKAKKVVVLPGDFLAYPEEFLPGQNAYEAGDSVRASLPGTVDRDFSKREVGVKAISQARPPSVGDTVLGQIEAAQTNTAGLKIYYVNGKPVKGGFSGTIFMRAERGGRGMRRTHVKLGDIVRARVGSTLNGMIQLTIDDSHLGVVFGLCSVCGRPLLRGNGRAKCDECGNVEERKFADDFGSQSIKP